MDEDAGIPVENIENKVIHYPVKVRDNEINTDNVEKNKIDIKEIGYYYRHLLD